MRDAVSSLTTDVRRRPRQRRALVLGIVSADDCLVAYNVEKAPAEWVYRQSNRRERRIWFGGALLLLVVGLFLALAIGHRVSVAASAFFLAAVVAARPYADRYADKHLRLLRGARAERDVGETLNVLRKEGWVVMHDIEQMGEGNIDHIASGPTGVYLVETKTRRYLDGQLTKVKRQAAKLHDELGVFVTPLICLHSREGKPFKTHGVWVVPRQELLGWLHSQHNRAVDFDRLARFADQL
jgi:Holliday junction resolvase-like predicted endonuclease